MKKNTQEADISESVIYCRVSSKEQEETGYSLPSQEKLLSEYSDKKDFVIKKIFSVAESASGAKQRKVFGEMMEYMNKNKIKNLVVEKVDRLTRNLKEAVIVNDWIDEDIQRKIHFVKQNLVIHKNAKSDEKFRWDIEIVLAKKYIANLSEEVKKGQAEKLAQGWLPTKPPIGYKTIGEKGHKIHVIDKDNAHHIKKLFELYASGNYSMEAVRQELYKDGFRTRAGKMPAKNRIEDILNEPFYYGAMRWSGVFYSEGKHNPIITKELFDKAQEVRRKKSAPSKSKHSYQFSKMMKCGECGGNVTSEIQKGIIYYHCSHYKECTQKPYTTEDKIEEQLFGVFKFFENITPEEAEAIKSKIKQDHSQEAEYKESALRSLNSRYIQLQSRLDTLYNDRLDQKISSEFWDRKREEINKEQEETQAQISKIKNEETKYFEIWLNILDLAFRAREIYEKRSPEERRKLLSYIFSNLMLKDKKVLPTLKKTVDVLSKRVQEKIDAEKSSEPKKNLVTKGKTDTFVSVCPIVLRE
jgi:DNA invertase Pin-like site-specific DNA recombinase